MKKRMRAVGHWWYFIGQISKYVKVGSREFFFGTYCGSRWNCLADWRLYGVIPNIKDGFSVGPFLFCEVKH